MSGSVEAGLRATSDLGAEAKQTAAIGLTVDGSK